MAFISFKLRASNPVSDMSINSSSETSKFTIAGVVCSSAGRSGKSREGHADFSHSDWLAMEARSIIGLCNLLASHSADVFSGTPQNA